MTNCEANLKRSDKRDPKNEIVNFSVLPSFWKLYSKHRHSSKLAFVRRWVLFKLGCTVKWNWAGGERRSAGSASTHWGVVSLWLSHLLQRGASSLVNGNLILVFFVIIDPDVSTWQRSENIEGTLEYGYTVVNPIDHIHTSKVTLVLTNEISHAT